MSSAHAKSQNASQGAQSNPKQLSPRNAKKKTASQKDSRYPQILYGGEMEAFETHIGTIQKALANQTFVFTRRTSIQSYNTTFSHDYIQFRRSLQNQARTLLYFNKLSLGPLILRDIVIV